MVENILPNHFKGKREVAEPGGLTPTPSLCAKGLLVPEAKLTICSANKKQQSVASMSIEPPVMMANMMTICLERKMEAFNHSNTWGGHA